MRACLLPCECCQCADANLQPSYRKRLSAAFHGPVADCTDVVRGNDQCRASQSRACTHPRMARPAGIQAPNIYSVAPSSSPGKAVKVDETQHRPSSCDIAIVGGGLGGLICAAAIRIARPDVNVKVSILSMHACIHPCRCMDCFQSWICNRIRSPCPRLVHSMTLATWNSFTTSTCRDPFPYLGKLLLVAKALNRVGHHVR